MQQLYGRSARRAKAHPLVGRLGQAGGLLRCTMGLALVVTVVAGLLGSCATAPATGGQQFTYQAK
jgi:uncharacterized protein (DUF697 family)